MRPCRQSRRLKRRTLSQRSGKNPAQGIAEEKSFRQIVDTRGNDISHLMNGLGALHQMYSLLYTLLVLVLLAGVVSLGLTLYKYYVA